MKKRLMPGAILAAVTLLAGCQADDFELRKGEGQIDLALAVDSEVKSATPVIRSRAEYSDVTPADLSLKLEATDGTFAQQWAKVADFPNGDPFKVGQYTMTAWYGTKGVEGFECPYFEGSSTFYVREGEETAVSLTATLANALVTVKYTDAFMGYMSDWSAQVHTAGGTYVDYAKNETRPAYLMPGNVTLLVNLTKQNGATASVQAAQFMAEAQHHYTVTVDVNNGNVGDAQLVVSFDDSIQQEDIVIDLSDEIMNASAPEVTAVGFTAGGKVACTEGAATAEPIKFNVIARGGIAGATLTTQSTSLLAQGWPAEIDLLTASDAQQQQLQALGLKVLGLWRNPDQMAVLDFTNVPTHIAYAEGDTEHTFTLVVRDRYMKVSEPVALTLTLAPITLTIDGQDAFFMDSAELPLVVTFNGGDLAKAVNFEIFTERGTWQKAVIKSVEARGNDQYLVVLTVPANDQAVKVRASFGDKQTEAYNAERKGTFSLEVPDNQAYAKHAYVTVDTKGDVDLSQVKGKIAYEISTDGTNYSAISSESADGTHDKLAGLEPSTKYWVRGTSGDMQAAAVTFTTEAASQLPNAGMEEWSEASHGNNWELVYPGASANASVWGTNNPLTTSQGSDYAYCRISGTISDGDSHSSTAAVIRTVGWGSGNTATGSGGSSGKTKYIDAGLLHLGSSRTVRPASHPNVTGTLATDDLNCGLAFASRPSALAFWYKYTAKNSADQGLVEYWVKDAAGTIIAQGTQNLAATDTYTRVEVPMAYDITAAKGVKIYVKFLSTNDESFLTKTNANLSGPGFANLSRGTFMGSKLYVDDIELVY